MTKIGETGPYNKTQTLYDPNRFSNQRSVEYKLSGTRVNPNGSQLTPQQQAQRGMRNTVYENPDNPESCFRRIGVGGNVTSLSEQVEKEMGNCVPCLQDTAPAYGPQGEANAFVSYPVRAQFENRKKWNQDFGSPFSSSGLKNSQGSTSGPQHPSQNKGTGPYVPQPNPQDQPNGVANQPPPHHAPVLLGCNIVSSGDDQYAHRFSSLNRWFNEENGEIMVGKPKGMEDKYVGNYSDELFKTPIDQTENKVSTGVMVNPFTGEMFETFENAMPPPNTNKFIPQDRFKIVNPKLVGAQGGINHHAPPPKKKEICLSVPGVDHGPNVWGDQLFADERRTRMREIANRDVWMNRDGDYAQPLGFAKERPAGFVGLNPQVRAVPHLPATQILDNKGYLPVSSQQFPEATTVKSEVFVRKPDLTTCMRQSGPEPINGIEAEQVVTQYTNRHTWRGYADTFYTGPANLNFVHESTEPQQKSNRPTLKEQMEQEFPVSGVDPSQPGESYVIQQFQNRPTLKEQMEQSFPSQNMVPNKPEESYVVQQFQNRPTLKEGMEQSFDPSNISTSNPGESYVVQQFQNRPTLKEGMEQSFDPSNISVSKPGESYVVQQFQNRSTLKEQMEQSFDPSNISVSKPGESYVVQQFQNRPTLKEQMEQEFPAQITDPGIPSEGHVVIQTTNRPTLKEQMEEEFPLYAVAPDKPSEGHVILDYDPKFTWKIEMEKPFGIFGIGGGAGETGDNVGFQGKIQDTRRQFYEELPAVGRHAHFDDGVGGENVGPGLVTSKQHRGTFASDYVTLSKVPADAEDTSVTWIGQHTRDTKRELGPHTGASDLSNFQQTMPRMPGLVTYNCNLDMHEVDDEFLWSSGFQYPRQEVIQG